ncbi:MAG: hypothetical protein HYR55_00980 [Acidobacteria bacterium]|nr:hypothetical protein [Acidobacteriota bacterium]MBI3658357.1 hypothetical protein [Acidobacteriota bacterium]
MNINSNRIELPLAAGETVTALFNARDGTIWYATTGRLIKYKRDRFEARAVEVPLDNIQGIQLQKQTNVRLMGFGAIFLALGMMFLALSLFFGSFSLAALFLLIGGVLFSYGYFTDSYTFQFQGERIDEEEWQIGEITKGARYFVQSVKRLKGLN